MKLQDQVEMMAKIEAQKLFEQYKTEFHQTQTNRDEVYYSLTESELTGRRAEIFNIIKESNKPLDRHEIADIYLKKHRKIVAASSICGRLSELTKCELIGVVGKVTGSFGKPVSLYGVFNEEI